MPTVFADVAVSVDGYLAGPNDDRENPLGDGGERLHEWVFGLASFRERQGETGGETGVDDDIVAASFENVGAYVMGRRMFDNGEGPWGDDPFAGYWGDEPPYRAPVFVLTHHDRAPLELGATTFHFVTDGVDDALDRALTAADGGDVRVSGGAATIQQVVRAGHLDELRLHVVPLLLGDGIRLFESLDGPVGLGRPHVVDSPAVTHLTYRVEAGPDARAGPGS